MVRKEKVVKRRKGRGINEFAEGEAKPVKGAWRQYGLSKRFRPKDMADAFAAWHEDQRLLERLMISAYDPFAGYTII